jgi:two-component system, NarL family, nitrate/nitrite response regulator NarL
MEHLDDLNETSKPQVPNNGPLTTRERQVIVVLAEGLTNKEIARRLKLAEGTVKVHLHRIYQKLQVANRTALAILAHTTIL